MERENIFDYSVVRHTLHALAEPSGEEIKTHQYIVEKLREFEPSVWHVYKDSYNVLAVYDSEEEGDTVLIRADFDAVKVHETLPLPYASQQEGVSHKCGHDGHAAILLGVANYLCHTPLKRGRVLLFFQAAEETGQGARQLLESGMLKHLKPDYVFALHNIPGAPMGTILCRPQSFTCSVVSCDIELQGRTAHAAEPWKACSPYPAAKIIADKLLEMNQYDLSREDFCLLTMVEFRIGEQAYGVAAGNGVLRFTLRTKQDEYLQQLKKRVISLVKETVEKTETLSYTIAWKEYFAAAENDDKALAMVQQTAEACQLPYVAMETPFAWGEDFGLLTQQYVGVLFGLGAGENQAPLHHPYYDFPDELVPMGVRMWVELLKNNGML